MNWLDQLLRHNETGYPDRPQTLRIEPEWHDGDTLPPKGPGPGTGLKDLAVSCREVAGNPAACP